MPFYDTEQQRSFKLSDGTTLVYRRPGGNTLRTVKQSSFEEAAAESEAHLARLPKYQRERLLSKNQDSPPLEKEDDLTPSEKKKRDREDNFSVLSPALLIHTCAVSWKFGTEDVCDVNDTESLRDLPDEILNEAAQRIYDSHYERLQDMEGN